MSDFESRYKMWHGYWSFVKSIIRIGGCLGVVYFGWGLREIAIAFGIAEVIGIAEEWI